VDLTTQRAGSKFTLGSDPFFGPYHVEDIEVLPGSPGSVAVSRKYNGVSPRHAGVATYDNGIQRPDVTPGHTGSNVIEFSNSPGTLYGYNNETTEFGFRKMTVTASGVSGTATTLDLVNSFSADIEFDGGRIYTTTGLVIDPEARTVLGAFSLPLAFGNSVKPDAALGRTYFLTQEGSSGAWSLRAFDQNSRQFLGSENIPGVTGTPSSLVRWGSKGLAFRTTAGKVFLLEPSTLFP